MNTTTDQVAATIRAELARRRLGQRDVADALGVSRTAVNRRMSGEVAFDVAELTTIARLLDVPVAELLLSRTAS